MGLMELNEDSIRTNRVVIRRQWDELRLAVDAAIFPLYCTRCNHPQPNLYVHCGSRYGQVGTAKCCKCGGEIHVIDNDNIVNSIFINNYPSNEIFFSKLYLLDVKYLKQLGKEHFNNIKAALLELAEQDRFIAVDRLRTIVENEMNILTTGMKKYVTDERFLILPEDINRWIEALENAGIKHLPVKECKESSDISKKRGVLMGLFDKLKKHGQKITSENKNIKYTSNINLGQLGFMEQLDRDIVVISDDENIEIDRAVHMCISQEALNQTLQEFKRAKQKEYQFIQLPLGMAVDNVIQKTSFDALIIRGLTPQALIITKEDLMPIKDLIDSFCIMYAAARNRISNEKAFELMKDKVVYILGTLPTISMKSEGKFGFDIIKRKAEDGEEYESVKCFLTMESANKYNGGKSEITPVAVNQIKHFFGSIIIEPHRNYWVEFR
ncbi:hypothetical protein ACJDT4_21045 [Clostridium neuense]|uniref:Uncharacterized protein n=1 Tax=Clostridium neuense TaxID=1728934 RepID=A0ABW8TKX1_9CLOT